MNISLHTLMDLLTYKGTVSNVTIDSAELIDTIRSEPGYDQVVYIEQFHPSRWDVWTIDGWIVESKRRNEVLRLSKEFKETYKPKQLDKLAMLKQMLEERSK